MSILPDTIDAKLASASQYADTFAANAAALGLDPQETTDFQTLCGNALDFRSDATNKRKAARAATTVQNVEVDKVTKQFGLLAGKIKGFANASADPAAVYQLADLPMPKTPEPRPAPNTPENLTLSLNNDGQITLKWDAIREGGTFFEIDRQTSSPDKVLGDWSTIATVQEKTYLDTKVPVGQASVSYRVRAKRGEFVSANSVSQTIAFGVGGASSGGMSMAA